MHAEFPNLFEKRLETLHPMNRNIKLLERTYFWILVTIFLLIVFTPYIIRSGFTLIQEEIAEVAAIALLFMVGYVVLLVYRKEADKNRNELKRLKQDKGALESRLSEAFRYIGTVNIQIEEIKSVFSDIRNFPETEKDFHNVLQFLAERTLSMVNAEWVLFRIIDMRSLSTLSEYSETRGKVVPLNHKISNKELASNEKFKGLTIVESGQGNFRIKTFCILPKEKLSSEGKTFIRAIVNQLEMLFVIFTSTYYKNSHVKNGNLSPR
jgi:DNA gyrase/topoisomerase IV subunit A